MDFWTTDDQVALQDGVRSFLDGRFPLEEIAAREETDSVIDRDRWRELADMGVFSLRQDGFGMREAVLVFEELGRALIPGPLVTTHLAAGLLDGASTGDAIVGHLDPQPTGDVVAYPHQCDAFVHFVDGRLEAHDASALQLDDVAHPLDALTPVGVRHATDGTGTVIAEGDECEALHQAGTILTSALALGVSLAATDLANQYAKERIQFGRPIGSFQAVKHLLADMIAKAEVARSAVYAAACALDGAGDGDVDRAAHSAKIMAGEAAVFCGKTGIQIHGGMGFTWEVHAQRYWKRAVVLESSFGGTGSHAQAMAEALTAQR